MPGADRREVLKVGTFQSVLLFTVAAQLAALLFTFEMVPLEGQISFAPVQGSAGPLANTFIFLAFPVAGSLLFLRYHKRRAFTYVYAVGESLLVAFLSFLILAFCGINFIPSVIAAMVVCILSFFVLLYGKSGSKGVFSLLLSSEAGAYLALVFSPPTIYLVILVFALYDYYSVNRGPLKKVVEQVPFGALSVDFGSVSMGLGDELFYSMVPAAAYLIAGPVAALLMLLVVDAGVAATLVLLSRRKALPGLTIPLLLALGLFVLLQFA
jgi:hypothetical protein